MPDTIDLDALPVNPNYREPIKDKEGTGVGDYGRAAVAGAIGVGSSLAAGADYLLDTDDDSALKDFRKAADKSAKYQIAQMSEGARDALNAGFLPGGDKSIWDADVSVANSLGLKLANASPSLLASIIPAGIVANVARAGLAGLGAAEATAGVVGARAGMTAAGGVNAGMVAGQVYDDIEKSVLDAKEEDLMKNSEMYKHLRDLNYTDTVARKVLVEAAAGNKPAIAGAIGALAEQFGAGALAAKSAAGVAEAGIAKGIKKGFVEEGLTEGAQGAFQEGATQRGLEDAGTGQLDARKAFEQALQGFVVGGIMGGAVGGVTGARAGRTKEAAPSVVEPTTPDTTPGIDPIVDAAARNADSQTLVEPKADPKTRARDGLAQVQADLDTNEAAIAEAAPTRGQKLKNKVKGRQKPDADIEAAINANAPAVAEEITPQPEVQPEPVTRPGNEPAPENDFVPENDYEVDPDYVPGQAPQAPAQIDDVAPTQATAPQELPAQPAEPVAAETPSEAPQTAGQEISLDDYPAPPSQPQPPFMDRMDEIDRQKAAQEAEPVPEAKPEPRVLKSAELKEKVSRVKRVSDKEAVRIAKGEGDAITLSHDPADWEGKYDRATVYKIANAFKNESEASGTELPKWAADVLSVRGKMSGNNPTSKANKAKYLEARKVLSDQTLEKQASGVARRETSDEAATRQLADKRRGDATRVAQILDEVPMSSMAGKGSAKAIVEHARQITETAKRLKIEAPVGTTDPHLVYIKEAAEIARGGVPRERVMDFLANDFFLRNNAGEELAARRRAQAAKSEQSFDEVGRPDQSTKEGADASEEYEAQGTGTEGSVEIFLDDVATEASNVEAPQAPTRAPLESNEGPSVVAGADRAGTFIKVEGRGRRKLKEAAARVAAKREPTIPGPDTPERRAASESYEVKAAERFKKRQEAQAAEAAKKDEKEQRELDRTLPKFTDEQAKEFFEAIQAEKASRETNEQREARRAKEIELRDQNVRDFEARSAARKKSEAVTRPGNTQPSEAQKEAGNYKKEHKRVLGMDVSIENKKGGTRSGTDPNGREWSVQMPADYGYVRGTKGVDGDHVDVYLGPSANKYAWETRGEVFVINQQNLDGTFDEHKAMVGFDKYDDAIKAYKAGFSDGKGKQRIQSVARFTPAEFKKWVAGDIKGPAKDLYQRTQDAQVRQDDAVGKAKQEVARLTRERDAATKGVTDLQEAMEIARPFVDKLMVERKVLTKELGEAEGRRAYEAARKDTAPVALKAMPKEANAETTHALAEIDEFFNSTAESDFDPSDGVDRVVSPRTGVGVRAKFSGSLGNLLREVDHTQTQGISAQIAPFMARRLRDMVGDVPVRVVSKADIKALVADLAGKGGFPQEILGYYEPSRHEIVLSEDALDNDAAVSHLLIHEGMHAAFMDVLNKQPAARAIVEQMMDDVRVHLGDSASGYYGMTNVHEFISEAFSSSEFQNLLASIPATRAYRSLRINNVWQHFLSGVRKFLRLAPASDSMLDAALRVGATLTDLRTAMNQPSTPRAPYAPAAMAGPINEQIRDGLSDRGGAIKGAMTRTVMRVRTLDQLRQFGKDLFPDSDGGSHLDRVVRNLQRMQPFVAEKREAGERFAEEFLKLQRSNPKVAQESAELRIDATMANVNLLLPGRVTDENLRKANPHIFGKDDKSDKSDAWQSKSKINDLQKRFSALPEAVQRQMIKEADYYKQMQSDISDKLVFNILDYFAPDISVDRRREIASKTLSGTLNEEDRKALNNNTFFNALKGAKELRSMQGMYFPLMRHGDYVVRTTDKVADLMGGTETEPGVVEFRATKDKEARAQAEKFAKATDLTVTRIVKRYFDPTTGEAIKAVDADAGSHVSYQVKVQTEGVHFFDTRTQAERFTREARKEGTHQKVSDWQERENLEQRGDLTGSQLSSLVSSIRARDDIPEGQRQMMATAIGQAAVRLMSGNRIQQKSLPRRRVQGASAEYARNSLRYATAASGYLGKLEYMPRIREAMGEMRKQASDRFGPDAQTRYHLYQEVAARVDSNEVGINQPSGFVRDLFAVTMLSKLFSPAHSIINAMQPAMVTYPILAGEHGPASSALELTRAFRDTGAITSFGQGVGNTGRAIAQRNEVTLNTTDVVADIRSKLGKSKDGAELGRVLDELRDRGALDDKAQFEMAASVAAGRGVAGTALAKMDRIFRQAPAAVEAVNRTVTAVAAYRLARRKGQNEEAARAYAFDVVMNTQGDYSPVNAAPIFNNPIARPFLQFKKYGQMMTNLYADMIWRAFKSESKADRKIAFKQFMNMVAVQTLAAGAMSLPGLELYKAGFIVAGMLGLSGGYGDEERRIKRLADEAVGETWSELVRKGIVSRAIGIDLSSRMSLADMWTFGEPKKYKSAEITQWIAEQYFGASGGTVAGYQDGIRAIHDGDLLKAATKIVPIKAAADLAKAVKGYNEDSLGLGEAAVTGMGFRPSRIANKQEERATRIDENNEKKDARNSLRTRYINASTSGERLKIKAEVLRYNKTADGRNKLSIPSMDRMREEDRKERMK